MEHIRSFALESNSDESISSKAVLPSVFSALYSLREVLFTTWLAVSLVMMTKDLKDQ